MFTGSLQPTDAQDNSNMKALSYSAKCCVMLRFMSAVADICNKNTQQSSFINAPLHSRAIFLF